MRAASILGLNPSVTSTSIARLTVCLIMRVPGSCVIRGCVPKKLMWYASAFAEEHRDALGFGWNTDKPKFDIKTLMGKKARLLLSIRLSSVLGCCNTS